MAEHLGYLIFDLDKEVVKQRGLSIDLLLKQEGEEAFRLYESRILTSILDYGLPYVLALGGGTPCFFDNMDNITQKGVSLYLQLSWKAMWLRYQRNKGIRPLLNAQAPISVKDLEGAYAWRIPYYERATYTIHTDKLSPVLVLEKMLGVLH